MIIGVDISSTQYGTGVSDYTLNLVKNLIKIDKKNTYKLFFTSLRQPLLPEIKKLSQKPQVKIYRYYIPLNIFEILFNRLHLPIELFIGKCDIFHTSDWTQPTSIKAKLITTVHDLVPLLFPQWQHPKIINTHKRKLDLATRHCAHVICVSKNTQKDLLRLFPKLNSKKTTVIYEATADKYHQFTKLSPPQQAKIKRKIKNKHHLDNYLLAQGTREPRKNLDRLIKAFLLFKKNHPQSKIQLVITGKYGWGKDVAKKLYSDIKILGFVPEADLLPLHASAIALIYPSLYEGFGLPILKSLSLGIPVITSNTSSIPEVAGKAALYINPKSISSIQKAINQIITSSATHYRLSQLAKIQAQKFSWIKTAKQTLKIYKKLIN